MTLEGLVEQFRAADRPPDLYLRPVGILTGPSARAALLAGEAAPFGKTDAFMSAELVWRGSGDRPNTMVVPLTRFYHWLDHECPAEIRDRLARQLTCLQVPLADWAGFALDRPLVMGIVNVTPDSFSDGGDHADAASAIAHGRSLLEAGADLLDIGGESTRPGALPVPAETEIARVVPVITALARAGATISIDTRHPAVMAAALDAGAAIVNDVAALRAPGALALAISRRVPVVLMHMRGDPKTMQAQAVYSCAPLDVWDFLEERLAAFEAAGGDRRQVLVDPGIGFGKTIDHNLAILSRLELYRALGSGVLLGVSRKRLIEACHGVPTPPKARLAGSLALAVDGVARGASVLRVHDVAETVQALRLWHAVRQAG